MTRFKRDFTFNMNIIETIAYNVIKYRKLNNTWEVEVESLTGTTDTEVTPSVKPKTGFVSPSTKKLLIKADGSAEISYEYERKEYNLTLTHTEDIDTTFNSGKYHYDCIF